MKLIYSAKPELAPNLTRLLTDEGLAVTPDLELVPDDAALPPVQEFEVTMAGEGPPQWQVVFTTIEVEVARFRELFPDAGGEIIVEGEPEEDANTPEPSRGWHVAT
jgi:hypothetical protein